MSPIPFSFELFPPKTPAGLERLQASVAELRPLGPEYFSVTYGAGGSTRERTFETVAWLREQGIDTAPHLSCIGSQRSEIDEILDHYRNQGIHRLVALRGDMPSGMGEPGDFHHADELVRHIRATQGDWFRIEVAAYPEFHPQAANARADLDHFEHKVKAGADGAITQYFYNADAYFAFRDDCVRRGIEVPIVPGIMPITNYLQLARFSDACGAEIPRWVRKRLEACGDDLEAIRAFGHEVVLGQCQRLMQGGAPAFHFYTLNQAAPALALCRDLGLA